MNKKRELKNVDNEGAVRLVAAMVVRCFRPVEQSASAQKIKKIRKSRVNFAYSNPFICDVADAINVHHTYLRERIIKGNNGKWEKEKMRII